MEKNLEMSLATLFGGDAIAFGEIPSGPGKTDFSPKVLSTQDLILKAFEHFQKANAHQKQGNWADYGKELDRLENTLRTLKNIK